jgi:hypothetical protein
LIAFCCLSIVTIESAESKQVSTNCNCIAPCSCNLVYSKLTAPIIDCSVINSLLYPKIQDNHKQSYCIFFFLRHQIVNCQVRTKLCSQKRIHPQLGHDTATPARPPVRIPVGIPPISQVEQWNSSSQPLNYPVLLLPVPINHGHSTQILPRIVIEPPGDEFVHLGSQRIHRVNTFAVQQNLQPVSSFFDQNHQEETSNRETNRRHTYIASPKK